jgi:hypothetical protein
VVAPVGQHPQAADDAKDPGGEAVLAAAGHPVSGEVSENHGALRVFIIKVVSVS